MCIYSYESGLFLEGDVLESVTSAPVGTNHVYEIFMYLLINIYICACFFLYLFICIYPYESGLFLEGGGTLESILFSPVDMHLHS
jgi:hypothetical protein